MRAAPPSLICFDLDGTLVDSAPDLCLALGAALNALGLERPTERQTRSWIGDGVENLLRRALAHAGSTDNQNFRSALDAFHVSYMQNLFNRSVLYPDAKVVLQRLQHDGHRLCCITNKRFEYAQELLVRADIAAAFEFVFGGDTFEQKKPHPRQLLEAAARTGVESGNCVMVGDSDTDSDAAAAAGYRFFWAAWGYCPALKNRAPADTMRIAQLADLPEVLQQSKS